MNHRQQQQQDEPKCVEWTDKSLSLSLQNDETDYDHFLSPGEEALLTKHYETILRDFCRKFQPPMPRCVVGTAFQYYKRFYLNNSVMDFHPKHIVVTCVYMAAKVEEFNVSMAQFVANVRGDREKASAIVLNNELFLMQQLKYHLTVHNPLRSIEGFIIDMKTRFPQCGDPEKLRPHIDHFIELTFSTNACFLLSPSQIALSAVVYAASKVKVNLDGSVLFVTYCDAFSYSTPTRRPFQISHRPALCRSDSRDTVLAASDEYIMDNGQFGNVSSQRESQTNREKARELS